MCVTCRGSSGEVPITGWAIELADADVVVATAEGCVNDLDQKAVETAGDQAVGFVRVPVTAASTSKPGNWGGPKTTAIPSVGACKGAWKKASKAELRSSEAEAPQGRTESRVGRARDLKRLESLFNEVDGSDKEEEDDEEFLLTKLLERGAWIAPEAQLPKNRRLKLRKQHDDEDDLSGRGMQAVSTLHRLHARIMKKRKRVCELFRPGKSWG